MSGDVVRPDIIQEHALFPSIFHIAAQMHSPFSRTYSCPATLFRMTTYEHHKSNLVNDTVIVLPVCGMNCTETAAPIKRLKRVARLRASDFFFVIFD